MTPFRSFAIDRGITGCGLDIDASSIHRLAVKAQTFAFAGDVELYRVNAEMLAEMIERLAPIAAEIRAELADLSNHAIDRRKAA